MRQNILRVISVVIMVAVCASGLLPSPQTSVRPEFFCVKKDGAGRTWAVRERLEGRRGRLALGPLAADGTLDELAVFIADGTVVAADLDFDLRSRPWLAWVEFADSAYRVRVAGLGAGESRVVNAPWTASALSPVVRAGANGDVWVFWTGRDSERDEIFGARRQNGAWSPPVKLDADSRFPHIRPAAAVDGAGRPRVVWSAHSGTSYEIVTVAWDGAQWTAEEPITDDPASDLVPAVVFIRGMTPVVVWNRVAGSVSSLLAKVKNGTIWSPEIVLVENASGPVRGLELEAAGDDLVVTWKSGGGPASRSFALSEILARAGSPAELQVTAVENQAARNENEYVGFGDSITYADGDGYVPKLEALLAARYGSAKVWNAGEGGETTADGLGRIDRIIAATTSGWMLLLEGTNDIIDSHVSADTTAFNLQDMTTRCVRAGMRALLATILPRNDSFGNDPFFRSKIDSLNAKIRLIPAATGASLVDMFTAFFTYPASAGGWTSLLLPDGVHPNDTGFTFMAQTWFGVIRNIRRPKAPLSPALDTRLDSSGSRKTNTLSWQANPQNAAGLVAQYRVFRKRADQPDTAFAFLASVAGSILRYEDANLSIIIKYAYRLTAVSAPGDESDPSATAIETREFVFPPLDLSLATSLDSTETEKTNVLTWQPNPNNAATPLAQYRVYRKRVDQPDEAFTRQATLPASSLEYEDANLAITTKYAYRLTAVSVADLESDPSASVTETREFVFPPIGLALATSLDANETEKKNTITWQANPNNAATALAQYRVFRKRAGQPDTAFALWATAAASSLVYEDAGLDIKTAYSYRLTAVTQSGQESKPSASVLEAQKFEFPPLDVAVRTALNKILFYEEKFNTITFAPNGLNEEADVSGYAVYRRKAEDGDEALARIATVDPSTLSYTDGRLPSRQKYAYAVTALFRDGRESRKSATVAER